MKDMVALTQREDRAVRVFGERLSGWLGDRFGSKAGWTSREDSE